MSENTRALAERYIQEYKRTPELGNWDHVIELGKRLADSVIAEGKAEPRTAQPAKHIEISKYVPNADEIELMQQDKFVQAVKALCQRLGCSIPDARKALEQYKIR